MAINSEEPHYSGNLRVRVCGICLQQDKILLVHHKPFAHNTAGLWSPPGGGLHFGESIKAALQREFFEETGLKVEAGRFLFMREYLTLPIHAIELFFEVNVTGGSLATGHDPELDTTHQLITEVAFKSLPEIQRISPTELHQAVQNLAHFNDLYQFSFASNLT